VYDAMGLPHGRSTLGIFQICYINNVWDERLWSKGQLSKSSHQIPVVLLRLPGSAPPDAMQHGIRRMILEPGFDCFDCQVFGLLFEGDCD
jgi:hypothetical protein